MGTEGAEHEGLLTGTHEEQCSQLVVNAGSVPRSAPAAEGVVSLLEPQFPHVHSKGRSSLRYLPSFTSQTPFDNLIKDTNSRKMHRHEKICIPFGVGVINPTSNP